jgi:hypothetical protein
MAGATSAVGLVAAGPSGTLHVDGRRTIVAPATRRALARGSLPQHRLERAIARLQGCLAELSDRQQRVLSLRAGLGSRPALTPTEVARRLHLGVAQAERIERRGLRRLGVLDGAGRCAGAAASDALRSSVALAGGSGTPTAGALDGLDEGSQPRSGIKGVSKSGGGDDGGSGGLALPPPIGNGGDWTLLILLALAAMLGVFVRRELRRR